MSSFINTPEHFNAVEFTLINLLAYNRDFYPDYALRDKYKCLQPNTKNVSEIETLCRHIVNNLANLNILCVSLQYKHHYEGKLDEEIKTQTEYMKLNRSRNGKHLSLLGLYNALRCINYQIETEHLKDLRELNEDEENAMQFLDLIVDSIAHHLVSKLPEDKTCTWSL